MKTRTHAPIISALLMLISCDLPHQPGPMPSEIVETHFESGLNIIGVLRADDLQGSSFISINRALTTEEIYSDSIENFSPEVDSIKLSATGSGAEYRFRQSEDSLEEGTYRDSSLTIQTGERYELEIRAPGFPVLTAETSVPEKAQLVGNSLVLGSDRIDFTLLQHASAYEYKLYLIFAGDALEKVIRPSALGRSDVQWNYDPDLGSPLFLMIAALDENLTRYGNSPISFIPNTYHRDGSTVTGGYGCFGSVSIALFSM